VLERYADGSYRIALRWNNHCRSDDQTPIPVRVIAYTLPGIPDAEARYRVITSILEPDRAPAPELAALYHERWEIETAFDEFKTHLRGARCVLHDEDLAHAIVDRVLERGRLLTLDGPSLRTKHLGLDDHTASTPSPQVA